MSSEPTFPRTKRSEPAIVIPLPSAEFCLSQEAIYYSAEYFCPACGAPRSSELHIHLTKWLRSVHEQQRVSEKQ